MYYLVLTLFILALRAPLVTPRLEGLQVIPVLTRVGIVPPCRLTPRVGSRHGGTFPTRGDAILRNVKPVIPGVLVARGNWFNLSYDSITSVS